MGGKSTTDLVAEFVRDSDDPTAIPAASWRRAVDLVSTEVLTDMRHPLFWAGYMLIDGGTSAPVEAVAAKGIGGRPAALPAAGKRDPAAVRGDRGRGAK